jgi:hypothetical protein
VLGRLAVRVLRGDYNDDPTVDEPAHVRTQPGTGTALSRRSAPAGGAVPPVAPGNSPHTQPKPRSTRSGGRRPSQEEQR